MNIKRFFFFVSLSLFALLLSQLRVAGATSGLLGLPAVADSFIDQANPVTNFEGKPLSFQVTLVENEQGPIAVYCPQITQQLYLKFDLSQVDFSIAQAQLQLMSLQGVTEAALALQLQGSADTWGESSLMWINRPTQVTPLFSTPIAIHSSGYLYWRDSGNGGLATWLESQRLVRGGDDTVTLTLSLPLNLGCWPYPDAPELKVALLDRLTQNPPMLFVADSVETLPMPAETLAVQTRYAATMTSSHVIAILGLVALMGMVTLVVGYRVANRPTLAPLHRQSSDHSDAIS